MKKELIIKENILIRVSQSSNLSTSCGEKTKDFEFNFSLVNNSSEEIKNFKFKSYNKGYIENILWEQGAQLFRMKHFISRNVLSYKQALHFTGILALEKEVYSKPYLTRAKKSDVNVVIGAVYPC